MNSSISSELMTPAEVASVFRVDPKTVARWSNAGKIPSIRTLGGHRRFRRVDIEALLDAAVEEGDHLEHNVFLHDRD